MRWQVNLMKLVPRIEAGLFMTSKVMCVIAMVDLFAMMLLTVADVVGRYFFYRPIPGAWELSGLLLVCAGTWGLGYTQIKNAHIRISILVDRFSPRVQAILRSFAYLIGLAGFSLICWQMFLMAKTYFFLTAGNETETLGIPYYPFMLMLATSVGVMTLIILVDLLHSLLEASRK